MRVAALLVLLAFTATCSGSAECSFDDCFVLWWDPVCGSDGTTYRNDCELRVAKCNNPDLTEANRGLCPSVISECLSMDACTALSDPVCGSDGKTYKNDCELTRAQCKNPDLDWVSHGECP